MSDELREQIKKDQETEEMAKALHRLNFGVDFKKVIQQYLLTQVPNELVSSLACLVPDSPEYKEIIRTLDHISYLRQFFKDIEAAGVIAQGAIREAQAILNNED